MDLNQKQLDIVFVASCNVDLITYVDRIPKIGETLNGNSFQIGFGGKGANTCIVSSRLQSKCAIICKVNEFHCKKQLYFFRFASSIFIPNSYFIATLGIMNPLT